MESDIRAERDRNDGGPPRLSVALCTYNGEPWIGQFLESLAAQTCAPDELVVQDDCSGDATVALVESFARTAPFVVRLERNEWRLGSTANFETALARCRGRYIALADQDDIWYPTKVRRVLDELESDPTVTLVFSNADLIDGAGRPLGRLLWETRLVGRTLRRNAVVSEELFARQALTTGCTMVIRRRAADAALPFPVQLQDPVAPMRHDRWLSLVAAAVGTVRALPESLLAFRVHDAQQTGVLIGPRLVAELLRAARAASQGMTAESVREHLVRADQLEAAAERADLVGDFEEADTIRRIAGHHRLRARLDDRMVDRLRTVGRKVRSGVYDHTLLGIGAASADVMRALHPPPPGARSVPSTKGRP